MANLKLRSLELLPRPDGVYTLNVTGTVHSVSAKVGVYIKPVLFYEQDGNAVTLTELLPLGTDTVLFSLMTDDTLPTSIILCSDRGFTTVGSDVELCAKVSHSMGIGDVVTYYAVSPFATTPVVINPLAAQDPYTATWTPEAVGTYTIIARLTNANYKQTLDSTAIKVVVSSPGVVLTADQQLVAQANTSVALGRPIVTGDVMFNADGTIEVSYGYSNGGSIKWPLIGFDNQSHKFLSYFDTIKQSDGASAFASIQFGNGSALTKVAGTSIAAHEGPMPDYVMLTVGFGVDGVQPTPWSQTSPAPSMTIGRPVVRLVANTDLLLVTQTDGSSLAFGAPKGSAVLIDTVTCTDADAQTYVVTGYGMANVDVVLVDGQNGLEAPQYWELEMDGSISFALGQQQYVDGNGYGLYLYHNDVQYVK